MTHRERFFALLEGRPLDRAPFFPDVTNWYAARRTLAGQPRRFGSGTFIPDDDPIHQFPGDMPEAFRDWTFLDFHRRFDWGLPVHLYDWARWERAGFERSVSRGGARRVTRLRTPLGTLEKVELLAADGSWAPVEHFAKGVGDLEVAAYVARHTRVVPDPGRIRAVLEAVGPWGVGDVVLSRSPFGKLVHEWMGVERTAYALVDAPAAVRDYLAVQERADLVEVEQAARMPARVVILSDHADESLIPPTWYREFCIPFYRKACRILHDAGKVVSTHLDGNIRGILPLLGETTFDLLDGCTPAPMTNYEVEGLAQAMPPGMSCYCGVPATFFSQGLPTETILAYGRRILDAFAGRVLLNVGDILPTDGSIEQVIALGELAGGYPTA